MRLKQLQTALLTTITLFFLTLGATVRGQDFSAASDNTSRSSTTEVRQISSVRSQNTTNGSRVVLTFEGTVTDYGAYRNGNKFLVLIPGAELSLNEIVVKGDGFSNSKVEARGTNLAFTFHLDANIKASVSENGNRIEITFTRATAGGNTSTENVTTDRDLPSVPREGESVSTSSPLPDAKPESANFSPSATVVAQPLKAPQGTGSANDNITQRAADFSVPESPAFTVLGVTPETVTHPTTAREFATSFLNGVDQQGNFQTGLAFDFVPFLTFFGDSTSLFSYRQSRVERFLARTQLSFATTKGVTEEDKATRLALGARFTLWDKGDPRLDNALDACYTNALKDPRLSADDLIRQPGETPEQETLRLLKRKDVLAEVVKSCNDAARKRNWNASGWILGVAPSWISKTGETRKYSWNGAGVWTSLAYGFENVGALKDNSQLILHARYRNNEVVPDSNNAGKFLSQDSLFFGGRLRLAPGSEAKSIFSLEGTFLRSRQNKGAYDNSSRFSLGLEQRIIDNIWFSLSLGGQSGRADGHNNAFVLSSFKWGFDQKK
jgi:hypothetical protein